MSSSGSPGRPYEALAAAWAVSGHRQPATRVRRVDVGGWYCGGSWLCPGPRDDCLDVRGRFGTASDGRPGRTTRNTRLARATHGSEAGLWEGDEH